jgi:hypothetical protein
MQNTLALNVQYSGLFSLPFSLVRSLSRFRFRFQCSLVGAVYLLTRCARSYHRWIVIGFDCHPPGSKESTGEKLDDETPSMRMLGMYWGDFSAVVTSTANWPAEFRSAARAFTDSTPKANMATARAVTEALPALTSAREDGPLTSAKTPSQRTPNRE